MFTRRRQRKVPKVPRRGGLTLLFDQAAMELAAQGTARCPAGPWLAAARVFLNIRHTCGWDLSTTPEEFLAPMLAQRGWSWRWEGDDLVMVLPGWIPPAPVIMAIQPGLFD
jgi:hypothetical protein